MIRSELYRIVTIRSWWMSLLVAAVLCALISILDHGPWAVLVGTVAFLFGVLGTGQHYQYRTAVTLFLARPRRRQVLLAHTAAYAAVAAALAAVTGAYVLVSGDHATYGYTIVGSMLLAGFAVANATILRRPIWILMGYGMWFLVVEGIIGQMELPEPFTGFILGAAVQPTWLFATAAWSAVALLVAAWAVERDVISD